MFSSKDFEKCWFLYQSEGLPHNLSIERKGHLRYLESLEKASDTPAYRCHN